MPANRSRTQQWRRCLQQIHERGGAIEIAVARSYDGDEEGNHLVWRVRVLAMSETEITIEQPVTLGQVIPFQDGIELVGILSVGQNRWTFGTRHLGPANVRLAGQRTAGAMRIAMPTSVRRCQRRNHTRVSTNALHLPEVDMWPLLDPKSVVLAERANELEFERAEGGGSGAAAEPIRLGGDEMLPEVGPRLTATLMNIGGGGVGLLVAPEHQQLLARHRVFWTRFALPPELTTPICASAKLVHTHMQSDQHVYAGIAFDFTFNAGHQRFVVEQICRFIAAQQSGQVGRKSA